MGGGGAGAGEGADHNFFLFSSESVSFNTLFAEENMIKMHDGAVSTAGLLVSEQAVLDRERRLGQ